VASAKTFLVDKTYDAQDATPGDGSCDDRNRYGGCTLRAAVMEANAWAGPDVILLPNPTAAANATILLTIPGRDEDGALLGDLDITDDVEIRPQGFSASRLPEPKPVIDSGRVDRVFQVHEGVTVWITGVILRRGDVGSSGEDGGGLLNEGVVLLRRVEIRECIAGRNGGAIHTFDFFPLQVVTPSVTLEDSIIFLNSVGNFGGGLAAINGATVVRNSSIVGNVARNAGGGIYHSGHFGLEVSGSAILGNLAWEASAINGGGGGGVFLIGDTAASSIQNTTVADNISNAFGGGIFNRYSGLSQGSPLVLRNVTVTGNQARPVAPEESYGGGLAAVDALIQLDSTIVSGNAPENCRGSAAQGELVSLGHNLAGDFSCELSGPGDLPNTDPTLGPLLKNGGTTLNRAPLPSSPALDAGGACLAVDQRQVTRPQASACDIGSVELATQLGPEVWLQKIALGSLRKASTSPVLTDYKQGFPASVSMSVDAEGTTSELRAQSFLERYADLYLLANPDVGLVHVRTDSDPVEGNHVRFGQTYRDLPVYGAEIVVHLEAGAAGAARRVTHTSGMLMPTVMTGRQTWEPIQPDTAPAITEMQAAAAAAAALGIPPDQLRGEPSLVYYDSRIFGEKYTGPTGVRLAYRVALGLGDPVELLVDASSSEILLQHSLAWASSHSEYDLALWDHAEAPWCSSGSRIGDEAGISPAYLGDPDAVTIWHAADATAQYFDANFDRHSHDDEDGEVQAFVHVGSGPAGARASASCGIGFGSGEASLDVFAHEFTHLVTHEESRLLHHGESGALAEAFSDVIGLVIDPQDTTTGEDRTSGAGAFGDVADPASFTCFLSDQVPASFPCPDQFSDYRVSSDDDGAVHANSGIIGKAFYLMADGPGGFGRAKMAQLAYRTFTQLARNDGLFDARAAAIDWTAQLARQGLHGFTPTDVCTVRDAFAAVGIGKPDNDCDGMDDDQVDPDADGIASPVGVVPGGSPGPNPCAGGHTQGCDDNCPFEPPTPTRRTRTWTRSATSATRTTTTTESTNRKAPARRCRRSTRTATAPSTASTTTSMATDGRRTGTDRGSSGTVPARIRRASRATTTARTTRTRARPTATPTARETSATRTRTATAGTRMAIIARTSPTPIRPTRMATGSATRATGARAFPTTGAPTTRGSPTSASFRSRSSPTTTGTVCRTPATTSSSGTSRCFCTTGRTASSSRCVPMARREP